MNKIRALLKSRRGLTLVEVLITVTILAILLPATIGSMFSVMESYGRIKNMADLNVLSANLENVISNQIAYGYNAKISSDNSVINFEKYGSESVELYTYTAAIGEISTLYMNGAPFFDVSYYNGINTVISFTQNTVNNVITVTMKFSGAANYTTSFTVKPISIS